MASSLDKDLKKVVSLETATHDLSRSIAAPGLALVFVGAALVWALLSFTGTPYAYMVVAGAVVAAYMALNVGANDVANNMGPAVGGKALTMVGALAIAAICEASGALLAGGDVVSTVSSKLLAPDLALSARDFILIMMAASLASAMWIHLATFLGAPVSTTHSVVGGVVGAGIAASGFAIVAWPVIGAIVASWVISPALGGVLAAGMLAAAKKMILDMPDKLAAAKRWVPVFVAVMAAVFAMYLTMKGLSKIWKPGPLVIVMLGIVTGLVAYFLSRPVIERRVPHLDNRKRDVATLFRVPLIFATALLSFAHGANDVANAVGPLAAIVAAAQEGVSSPEKVALPLWVLGIGAIGISVGLALFGPRLIRIVGEKITKMNEIRAYCVALSAAVTVLIASALGLPVSSTHIAVGAVFGVGFLREFFGNQLVRNPPLKKTAPDVRTSKFNRTAQEAIDNYRGRERRQLVRRSHLISIAAAWVITVPASAVVAALLFFAMRAVAPA